MLGGFLETRAFGTWRVVGSEWHRSLHWQRDAENGAMSSPVPGRGNQLLRVGTWLGIYNNVLRYRPRAGEPLTQLKLGQDASIGGKKIQQIISELKEELTLAVPCSVCMAPSREP